MGKIKIKSKIEGRKAKRISCPSSLVDQFLQYSFLIRIVTHRYFDVLFQVGTFDPFSDDPRLGIQKMAMCPLTGVLVAAGSAGQVMYMRIGTEAVEKKVDVSKVAYYVSKILGGKVLKF